MAGDLEGSGPARVREALVGISTSGGRTLGHGFWADSLGTVLTADEVVAEAAERGERLRVRTASGRAHPVEPDALTRCPELGLAWLTPTEPAAARPLPVAEAAPRPGCAVLLPGARPGTLLGTGTALTGGPAPALLLSGVLLLDLPPGVEPAPGLPVLDPVTGVVLGLLAPRLRGLSAGALGAVPLTAARHATG
ncbi:hypothetical protein ACQRUO_37925, partial [Kitasatospora sp. LaBMicrA B282]